MSPRSIENSCDAPDRVVLARGEARGGPGLPVGRHHDQCGDEREGDVREADDLPVHRGAFARFETRSSKREQDEVGDDARPAVRDERERDPGQRDDAEDAADDDERLQREPEREPCGEELREAVLRLQRDAHPADDEDHEHEQQRRRADEPELLCDRREDEVGAQVGDELRPVDGRERPLTDPGAAEAAVRDRVQALHELVRRAVLPVLELPVEGAVDPLVRPGVQPDRDAVLDVLDRVVEDGRRRRRTARARLPTKSARPVAA